MRTGPTQRQSPPADAEAAKTGSGSVRRRSEPRGERLSGRGREGAAGEAPCTGGAQRRRRGQEDHTKEGSGCAVHKHPDARTRKASS